MTRGVSRPAPPGGVDHISRFSSVTVERRAGSGGMDGSGPTSRIASRSRAASIDARIDPEGLYGVYGPGEERGRPRDRDDSPYALASNVEVEVGMPENLSAEYVYIVRDLGDSLIIRTRIGLIGRKFGTRVNCERVCTRS